MDARQDGAEDGVLGHVQELCEVGVPGMDAVTFCFPGKVHVKGYQLQVLFHGSLIPHSSRQLLLCEHGWEHPSGWWCLFSLLVGVGGVEMLSAGWKSTLKMKLKLCVD